MFSTPTSSLRSLNDCNIKPKRTSYGEMSTWIYMDNINFDPTSKSVRKSTPKPNSVVTNPRVTNFLMKNWAYNTENLNKYYHFDKSKRTGKSGAWKNITESFKEDGSRLVFVNDPIVIPTRAADSDYAASEPKERVEKREEEKNRLGVQTRHGVNFGNWNIVR